MRYSLTGLLLLSTIGCTHHSLKPPPPPPPPPDLATSDLGSPPDLATPPDLAPPDLATPPDLAPPHFPTCGASAAPACGFAAPVAIGRMPRPWLGSTGDFNGDNKPDILIEGAPYVSVLLSNGDGTFKQQIDTLTFTSSNEWHAVGDFNKDGKLDVIVPEGAQVTVWLGNGDGTFTRGASRVSTAPSVGTTALVADVNEDKIPDLILSTKYLTPNALLFLGMGDGTLAAPQLLGNLVAVDAIADVDGDGHLDAIAGSGVSGAATLLVSFGDGKGGFPAPTSLAIPNLADAVTAGDIDGDGKADVAIVRYDGVDVFLSQGRTFKPVKSITATGIDGLLALLVDFDGDKKLDLVVNNPGTAVEVMLGDGSGGFAAPVPHQLPSGDGLMLAAADFDGDGAADAVTVHPNSVAIATKTGDHLLPESTFIAASVDTSAVGDFNGDGRADVVAFGKDTGTVSCALQQSDGSFSFIRQVNHIPVPIPSDSKGGGIVVGDFDHDSHLDAIVYGQLLLGNGDGTFHDGGLFPTGYLEAVGDFNEDGWLDVVMESDDNNMQVLLSDKTGPFKKTVSYGSGSAQVQVIDVNNDKHLDLVALAMSYFGPGTQTTQLTVYLGAGDGSFKSSYTQTWHDVPGDLVTGDFNCDGKPDVSAPSFLYGVGDGTFVPRPGAGLLAEAAGDFNHDGLLDVALQLGSMPPHSTGIALGNGDSTVQAPIQVLSGSGSMQSADLNGDGRPDLIVGSTGLIQVLVNSCTR